MTKGPSHYSKKLLMELIFQKLDDCGRHAQAGKFSGNSKIELKCCFN